jgi:hypothetical protein
VQGGVGIASHSSAEFTPLRADLGVVNAENPATAYRIVRMASGEGLMSGLVKEDEQPVITDLKFLPTRIPYTKVGGLNAICWRYFSFKSRFGPLPCLGL